MAQPPQSGQPAADEPPDGEKSIEFKGETEPAEAPAAPETPPAAAAGTEPGKTAFEIEWRDEEQLATPGKLFAEPPPEPPRFDFEIVRDPDAPPRPALKLPLRRHVPPEAPTPAGRPAPEPKPVKPIEPMAREAGYAPRVRPAGGHRAPLVIRILWAFMPLLLFVAGYAAVVFTQNRIGYAWDEAYYYSPALKAGVWGGDFIAGEKPTDRATIDRYWEERHEHPSMQKLLSGIALRFFADPRDHLYAMRLPMAILFGLTLTLLYLLGRRMLGPVPGLITALMYGTMPQIFGYAHFATMETPLVFFMLLTVWCFLKGLDQPFWSMVTGISFGLLLATKLNGFFLPIPLILWAHLYARRKYVNNLFAMLTLGPALFVGAWPWLWHDTLLRMLEYLHFHAGHQQTAVFFMHQVWGLNGPNAPWFYPLTLTVVTLPLLTLLFILWGAIPILVRPHRRPLGALFLLCALTMLGVASMPSTPRYDGVRLFLPAFAFLALVGAAGFVHVMYWIELAMARGGRNINTLRRFGRSAAALFGLAIVLEGGSACVRYYPYLLSYFNPLVGGLRGAEAHGYEVTYWNDALNSDVLDFLNSLPSPGGRPIRIRALAMHELCLDQLQAWGLLRSDIDFHAPPPYDFHLLQMRRGMFRRPERALADSGKFPVVKAWGKDGVDLLVLYQTGIPFEQYWPTLPQ